MQGRLLYIGQPTTVAMPLVQVPPGGKIIVTSMIACSTDKASSFSVHHLRPGITAVSDDYAIYHEKAISHKETLSLLSQPISLSEGEALYGAGDIVTMAVYGVTFP